MLGERLGPGTIFIARVSPTHIATGAGKKFLASALQLGAAK